MKVLYFLCRLEVGGLERFVTRMSLKAKDTGAFEPVVCCLREKRGPFLASLENAGIEVLEAPEKWCRKISGLIGLSSLINEIKPDIVHSQVNFSMAQQRLAVLMAGPKIKFCITERSEYQKSGFSLIRRIIQFHFLKVLDTDYTANSESAAKYLAHQVGVKQRKIGVIPNGTPEIHPDIKIRLKIRSRLGWGSDEIGLGYVARLAPGKGHELFIEVVNVLKQRGYPIRACLAGDGPKHDSCKDLVKKYDLENIISMPGTVLNVEDYLQAFDVVVLLSEREGMPNALLEAMSAGKPIIATAVGGIPEVLDYGRVGILVENNLESVVKAIEDLINDSDFRSKLGQMAKRQIEKNYSLDVIFQNLVHYYKNSNQK